jgi:hypothetical protein
MPTKAKQVYQLKITLEGVRPPIWRRVQVKDCNLEVLHEVIQTCLDWTNSHLHSFAAPGLDIGTEEFDEELGYNPGEERVRLSKLAARGIKKLTYVYDFGDNWVHRVAIEKVLPAEPGVSYPRCLTGKRAGPPEDCGGPRGYVRLLSILSDPTHKEHDEMNDWVPEDFDPEKIDLAFINKELEVLK